MFPIKLRAHHLLCIQGFQGYGYSQDFIKNMKYIINCLNSHGSLIDIITDCDVICSFCPYNKNGICKLNSASDLKKMDELVIDKLGLEEHMVISPEYAFSLVNKKLQKTLDADEVCGGCIWKEKCLWYLSRDIE
ncbi:protein of unknown function DUF1284 [Methanohalobium evestigatum Z-7303]|uniref:Iron-sulfur binding protein n=1 Tax=Methanohalobium evestigatum (strain ATCC BAA-1072 / DSM 3721 / NBRC 107634 / OCM 161 / Z-7303) TaxID=644295 RepID=D7E9U2_METEZ|nr:DUF1284 domain-containing protein [Methanohalobium evestigatum]ADI74364.1 protein of unknown function DUF1284 [Methanohalobium evestigatum Z-7303]